MIRFIFILTILIFVPWKLGAQLPSVYIKMSFDSKPLTELINYIEAEENIRFFYKKEWIDTIPVIQKSERSTLETILNDTFSGTDLTYISDNKKKIILSFKYRIETDLPDYLFAEKSSDFHESSQIDTSSFITKEKNDSVKAERNNQAGAIFFGTPGLVSLSGKSTIAGYVKENETGQPVIGALIYLIDQSTGTSTDKYGYYILSVPNGNHILRVSYLGRKDQTFSINVFENGTLNMSMEEKLLELRGVVISAEKDYNVRGLNIGLEKVDIQTIKLNSSSLGEGDLMKTALLLPGVKTVGEGASGFNVRGGSTDQNLILMDGTPLFNPSHMFGFFSVFNPDVVKEFKLYKSGIPAQFSGRLSSVLDVSIRNGDRKKYSVSGGISPVAGRLSIEGPVIKDKASFIISSRGSYSDWILKRTKVATLENSNASFIDMNAKIAFDLNTNNTLTGSAYYSEDYFRINSDTLYKYGNLNANINLKHTFSEKIFGLFSMIYSKYFYSLSSRNRKPYAFDLNYYIRYMEGRADFTWFLNMDHKLIFGANIIRYNINPGVINPGGSESLIRHARVPDEQALETGIYLSDEYNVTDALSINCGLRYSGFLSLGPSTVYSYLPGVPRSVESRTDSTDYGRYEIINYYGGPELRLQVRYKTGESNSVKMSYTKMYQYLHMMSNTTAISPTDIWKVSGPNLPPQKSYQVSAGYFQYLFSNKILSSVEVYFKSTENILEYRGGTLIIMNPELEVNLLNGMGKAYGFEIMLKKEYGALNGWMSYTYSKSLIKIDSKFIEDQLNQGRYFPSNYDKPHEFTIVSNYRFSRIHSISSTFTYSTGRPITYPVAKYQYRGQELIHYSNRNEYRIPDYLRWDISVNMEGRLKTKSLMQNSLSISAYNLLGRANAYSIFFKSDERKNIKGYKLSVFSQPVITVTYNFKF